MSEVVLDASALLALLNREPGHEEIAEVIRDAAISAVNLSEVAAKLADRGMPGEAIREALEGLALEIHDFDQERPFKPRFSILSPDPGVSPSATGRAWHSDND